jgi:hypothetical protein
MADNPPVQEQEQDGPAPIAVPALHEAKLVSARSLHLFLLSSRGRMRRRAFVLPLFGCLQGRARGFVCRGRFVFVPAS